MAIKYFISKKQEKLLGKGFVAQELNKALKQLEKMNSIQDLYDNRNWVYVKDSDCCWIYKGVTINGAPRYIFFYEKRDVQDVLILRCSYSNHDEYELKFNDVNKREWEQNHQMTKDELTALNEAFPIPYTKEEIVIPVLPEEYREYEKRPRQIGDYKGNLIVYETQEWNKGYRDTEDLYKNEIYNAVEKWVNVASSRNSNGGAEDSFFMYGSDGFVHLPAGRFEIVLRYEIESECVSKLFLINIAENGHLSEEDIVEPYGKKVSETNLCRKAVKCYPDFLLVDGFESWNMIEKDDNQANLALSNEELSVLSDIEYPFFVKGLAGSGKSTILYYLFAHVYDYAIKHGYYDHKLIFLSYSEKLVENAKNVVRSILCNPHSYGDKDLIEDKNFDRCFKPFQEFIKQTFFDQQDYLKFSKHNHLKYQKFKDLYKDCKLPDAKKYSADIVWSVIRTFIKGRSSEGFVTPEDYASDMIEKKDRTVSNEDYRCIYAIWNNWYRHLYEEDGIWDDLDLVRHVLGKKDCGNLHTYTAIFCDEAQDFTKIETDLILKLSVHSSYDLSQSEETQKIPIAFAGDPNQTINPTGFRMGSVQGIFNNAFKDALGTFAGFEPKELSINYRSREAIVHFANTIQLIRNKYLVEDVNSKYQKAWSSDDEEDNVENLDYAAFYSIDQYPEEIKKGLNEAIIITPEEGEYDSEESITIEDLKGVVDFSKLFTAITSKGLEFNAIILYKFSEDDAVGLFQKIVNGEPITDDSERYKLSHFFTKLYIAVSRARKVLFVVDTDEGYEKFWKYFINRDLLNNIVGTDDVRYHFGCLSMGNIEYYGSRLSKNYDPRENFEKYFNAAKAERSSTLMQRAYNVCHESNWLQKKDECKAYMDWYEYKYKEAGENFVALSKEKVAKEVYWEGKCWKEYVSISIEKKGPRFELAKYLSRDITLREFIQSWNADKGGFVDSILSGKDVDAWQDALSAIKKDCLKMPEKEITDSISNFLEDLAEHFDWYNNGMADLRATLQFRRATYETNKGRDAKAYYQKAASLWELDSTLTNHPNYYAAKENSSDDVSERIKWMDKLGKTEEIYKKYGSLEFFNNLDSKTEAPNIVFKSLLSYDYDEAINYPYPSSVEAKWNRLFLDSELKFVSRLLLTDFSEEKFNFILEQIKIKENTRFFSSQLPVEINTQILRLEGKNASDKPYWVYFFSDLRDNGGVRLMKNDYNRNNLLEALSKIIEEVKPSQSNKMLYSCFLEMLFDKSYNFDRAKKYLKTILKVFSEDLIGKRDFRVSTKLNRYFHAYCELDGSQLNEIKDHIHDFASAYIYRMGTIKEATRYEFETIARMYECSVKFNDFMPNFTENVRFYTKLLSEESNGKKFDLVKLWIDQRVLLNQLFDDANLMKSKYSKLTSALKSKKIKESDFFDILSKEDLSYMIGAIYREKDMTSGKEALLFAKQIYLKRLRQEDLSYLFELGDRKVREHLEFAIEKFLSLEFEKKRISEENIKLCAYVWETLHNHEDACEKLDALIKNERLEKMSKLTDYLKKRALRRYSFLGDKLFRNKEKEYGININPSDVFVYPSIFDKHIKDSSEQEERKQTNKKDVQKKSIVRIEKNCNKSIGGVSVEIDIKHRVIYFGDNDEAQIRRGNIETSSPLAHVADNILHIGGLTAVVQADASVCIETADACFIVEFKN